MATSTVPAVKKALRPWLRARLDAASMPTVKVATAIRDATTITQDDEAVVLGNVTGPQEWAGLGAQRKTETPTITCWIEIAKPGDGEDAIDAARDRAYAILAVVEAALRADPTAGGAIPNPNITAVAQADLEESPIELGPQGGVAGRFARLRSTITYTARI
jgi:hypothetical protein